MLEAQIFFHMHRNVFQRTSAVCRRGVLSVSVARNDRVGALVMVSLQSLSIQYTHSVFFVFSFPLHSIRCRCSPSFSFILPFDSSSSCQQFVSSYLRVAVYVDMERIHVMSNIFTVYGNVVKVHRIV